MAFLADNRFCATYHSRPKRCAKCEKDFDSVVLKLEHFQSCTKVMCPECKQRLDSETILNIHLKYKHNRWVCAECFELCASNSALETHMRANHASADKVVMLTRTETSWTASTMVGEELFRFDGQGLVHIGDLREKAAEAWHVDKQVLSFVSNGKTASDTLPLEGVDAFVMKRLMLVEHATKMSALEDARTLKASQKQEALAAALH